MELAREETAEPQKDPSNLRGLPYVFPKAELQSKAPTWKTVASLWRVSSVPRFPLTLLKRLNFLKIYSLKRTMR